MGWSLEQVVRPFQTKTSRLQSGCSAIAWSLTPIHVSFGAGGSTVFGFSLYQDIQAKTDGSKAYREISRETETKRVENPDDPNQYVLVEQPKSWKGRNVNDPTDTSELIFGTASGGEGGDGGGDGGGGEGGGGAGGGGGGG